MHHGLGDVLGQRKTRQPRLHALRPAGLRDEPVVPEAPVDLRLHVRHPVLFDRHPRAPQGRLGRLVMPAHMLDERVRLVQGADRGGAVRGRGAVARRRRRQALHRADRALDDVQRRARIQIFAQHAPHRAVARVRVDVNQHLHRAAPIRPGALGLHDRAVLGLELQHPAHRHAEGLFLAQGVGLVAGPAVRGRLLRGLLHPFGVHGHLLAERLAPGRHVGKPRGLLVRIGDPRRLAPRVDGRDLAHGQIQIGSRLDVLQVDVHRRLVGLLPARAEDAAAALGEEDGRHHLGALGEQQLVARRVAEVRRQPRAHVAHPHAAPLRHRVRGPVHIQIGMQPSVVAVGHLLICSPLGARPRAPRPLA